MAGQQGASLAAFAQGGLIDDIDVEILDAAFAEWDYNGSIAQPALALGIQYATADGKTYDQYYSAGDLQYFVPSEDGSMAVPVGDKAMLNDNTNTAKFLLSLMECGFPEDKLASGNVKCLIGTKGHVNRVAQPKRTGLIRGGKNAEKDSTVLLFSSISEFPGVAAPAKKGIGKAAPATSRPTQAGGAKPGLKSASTAANAPTATRGPKAGAPVKANGAAGKAQAGVVGDDLSGVAVELLVGILAEGPVEKKKLSTLAFRAAGDMVQAGTLDAKDKTKVVQLVFQDAFLHGQVEAGMIEYDGATVGLPA
jgi:hypothetical protein